MHLPEHTVRAFDADIACLRQSVVDMARLAERQFRDAVALVGRPDPARVDALLEHERTVNAMHLALDAHCNRIIALRQPIAVDLREVIGAMHTVSDLERIGDEAKKIALRSARIDASRFDGLLGRVDDMARCAADMLFGAIDAFVRHDAGGARRLAAADDEVDALRDGLVEDLGAWIGRDPAATLPALELILAVQSIERVADHAENVAGYVAIVVEGIDRRHREAADA